MGAQVARAPECDQCRPYYCGQSSSQQQVGSSAHVQPDVLPDTSETVEPRGEQRARRRPGRRLSCLVGTHCLMHMPASRKPGLDPCAETSKRGLSFAKAGVLPLARELGENLTRVDSDDEGQTPRGRTSSEGETPRARTSSGDSDASDADSDADSIVHERTFRGTKRHTHKRLMITHTMGSCPSSALKLIIESGDDIHKLYGFDGKTLGKGAFGVVKKATLKSSGAIRAVKVISKTQMKEKRVSLKKEIEIMKIVDHPSLLMLYEIFEDDESLYLVLQLCAGGHLEGYVKKHRPLTEVQVAGAMQQVLRAVNYLHKHRICHRDLKSENCLLDSSGHIEKCNVKVADFGLSRVLAPGESFKGIAGTLNHMAPEVLDKKYGLPCDLWSCGVMFFFLLSGSTPFHGRTEEQLKSKILHAHVQFATAEWLDISQQCLDFVGQLLAKNPLKRFSAERALAHGWMKAMVPKPDEVSLYRKTLEKVMKFRGFSKLQRAVLHVMATMLPDSDISTPRQFFIMVDKNGDGTISMEELRIALRVTQPTLTKGDQSDLTYTEFLAATLDIKKHIQGPLFRATFASFDKDGDGSLSLAEISSGKILGTLSVEEVIDEMERVDGDEDGHLDFSEFTKMMLNDK